MAKVRLNSLMSKHGWIGGCGLVLCWAGLSLPAQAMETERYRLFLQQGKQALAQGHIDAALEAFLKAARIDSRSATIQHKLASAYLLQGRYAESIEHFQQALRIEENSPKAFIGMGIAYLHLGQYRLARAAFLEAKRLSNTRRKDIEHLLNWLDSRNY